MQNGSGEGYNSRADEMRDEVHSLRSKQHRNLLMGGSSQHAMLKGQLAAKSIRSKQGGDAMSDT